MKRFYQDVTIAPAPGGFQVLLDGKPVRTPGRNPLLLPTQELAAAIALEWRIQGATVVATSMPLLRLANTVVDGVASRRAEVIAAILRFAENDLLCYRAAEPAALAARQREGWDPLLAWARQRLGADMRVVEGLGHVDQPLDALAALREALEEQDDFALGALHVIASITGSAVLALAVAHGRITAEDGFALSRIDEAWQAEKWGADAEAGKRAALLAAEMDKAFELLSLSR
jgi:chaperone required for assembly of F1-ATPase